MPRPRRLTLLCLLSLTTTLLGEPPADEKELRERARKAFERSIEFFRRQVSAKGAYLWRYSADLSRREGEGRATATMGWVQPPGTPSVGGAFLDAFHLTRDPRCRAAARETAMSLVRSQLRSGGWDYRIETDENQRKRYAYRTDPPRPKARNTTTLDDNTTQEALRFLMRVDKTLGFEDEAIHGAVEHALARLLEAQYPNGAWPQRFDGPPDPARFPVRKASYPGSWSRTWTKPRYRSFYTLNDNVIEDMVDTLFLAARIYERDDARTAAKRAGDFLIIAQMPDPQPGWAQQYDANMHPAWARKFEPPAVTGGESRGAVRTLLRIFRETGDRKYLAPISSALDYYESCTLEGGRLARFHELRTNKPLYFTHDYKLTYDDGDMPTHYAFKISSWVAVARKDLERSKRLPKATATTRDRPPVPELTRDLASSAKKVIDSLDNRGAWVEDGRLRYHGEDDPTRRVISSETFRRNLGVLSRYLAATR